MSGALGEPGRGKRWLLVVAAPKEARAVLSGLGGPSRGDLPPVRWLAEPADDRFDLLLTGVGKANAAAGLARAFDPSRHAGVVNLGVAGALPGGGLRAGDTVDADRCTYADEGSALPPPEGFMTLAEMGFGPLAGLCGAGCGNDSMSVACLPVFPAGARPAGTRLVRGGVATVSTCSGTDALAAEVARRTGAVAEDMEGAALGFTLARLDGGARFSALRVISNQTGDRAAQGWDLGLALDVLRSTAALL